MSNDRVLDMARREVENFQADRIDLAPGVYRVPTNAYVDRDRWQLEVDRVFKRLPLALGFSCELQGSGSYRALEIMETPVLLTRGDDGEVHAFMNMCSHRGAIIADEGCGTARGFRCPYHAWSYDLEGRLVSVFDAANFGKIDKSAYGLTPLPVAERAGLIWVTLTPGIEVDIDAFLSGYGEVLDHLGFADCKLVGRQNLAGPNWKVAYDGYRDLYHIPILHRNSFGPDSPYQPDYYAFGPHVRMVSPKRFATLADLPEEQWSALDLIPGVWTIYPNISIAGGVDRPYMVSQMFPGNSPGGSFTVQNFLLPPSAVEDPDRDASYMKTMATVVGDEDYFTGFGVQKALATGAKKHSLFGRNEGGGQLFHRWVEALVQTEDEDLPALLKHGIDTGK